MGTILGIDEELAPLRDMIWDLMRQGSAIERVHRIVNDGTAINADLDASMAELGLFGIDIDDRLGGGGGTTTHLRHVAEGCGWAAATTRLLGSSAAALGALRSCEPGATRDELLSGIATGQTAATVVPSEPTLEATVSVQGAGDTMTLHGTVPYVIDALTADQLLVVAVRDDEPVLVAVPSTDPTVTRERQTTVDLTRSLVRVTFDGTTVTGSAILARGHEAVAAARAEAGLRLALLVSADSLGVATRVIETTTEYAKTRVQFDRPIGSFQAVKHQAADMLARTEMARALVDEAAAALDDQRADAPRLVSMAKEYSCSTAAWVAGRGIQLHGGIGYTWEHEMHIFFKRAKLNEMLAGDSRYHRERIAAILGAERGRRIAS